MRRFSAVLAAVLAALIMGSGQALAQRSPRKNYAKLTAKMELIPAGSFIMGAPDTDEDAGNIERPQHEVYLDAYYMDRYEVTVADFVKFLNTRRSDLGPDGTSFIGKNTVNNRLFQAIVQISTNKWKAAQGHARHPITSITWEGAHQYCLWALKRLPTEAEWEKAARGGTASKWHFGDDPALLPQYAWHEDYSGTTPHPVGMKKPNQFGLYDMLGNAGEAVYDWYKEGYYSISPSKNPRGPAKGTEKILRGCSANGKAKLVTRSSARVVTTPTVTLSSMDGFRCALTAPPGAK